jgi:SPP1 family predicted phage head-tail adaptor
MSTTFPAITNAGQLDRRIQILHFTEVYDEYGQLIQDWVPIAEVWAARRDEAVSEVLVSGALTAVVSSKFRIRYRQGLTEGMRVVDLGQNRTYEVLGIVWEDRDEALTLSCRAYGLTIPLPSRLTELG